MNRKINTVLLKSIIDTEFLILSEKPQEVGSKFECKVSNRGKIKTKFSLNLFEILKNLKQIVRILQFLKNKNEGELIVCCPDSQISSFLNLYKKELKCSHSLKIELDCRRTFSKSRRLKSLLLLEEPLGNKSSVFKKLFAENILIISKINSSLEIDSNGTYKMYNDLSNLKKLAFLVTLIDHVLSTYV